MLCQIAKLLHEESGVAAVEFALAAVLLLALLVPVVELGQAYSQQTRVEQAVQAGALYATIHPWNSNSPTQITNAISAASSLSGLSVATPSQSCGCPSGTAVTTATCGGTCSDGTAAGYYVTVSAQLPYTPTTPYSLLGSGVTLAAQAVVRVQ